MVDRTPVAGSLEDVDRHALGVRNLIATATLAIVVSAGLVPGAGCGPGVDGVGAFCRERSCQNPPGSTCTSGLLRVYAERGQCELSRGTCSYSFEDRPCEHGCFDGSRCMRPGDFLWRSPPLPFRRFRDDLEPALRRVDETFYVVTGRAVSPALPAFLSLNAFAAEGGKALWEIDPWGLYLGDVPAITAPALAPGGDIYFGIVSVASGCRTYSVSKAGERGGSYIHQLEGSRCELSYRPAIARDGQLYRSMTMSSGGRLLALTAAGIVRWEVPVEGEVRTAPLLTEDGRVFVAGSRLLALNAEGKAIWPPKRLPDPEVQNIALADRKGSIVYLTTPDTLLAFRGSDGGALWVFPGAVEQDGVNRPAEITTSPVVSSTGEVIVAGIGNIGNESTEAARIYLVAADGATSRSFAVAARVDSLVLAQDGTIIASEYSTDSGKGFLSAYRPDGSLHWRANLPAHPGPPVIGPSGTVYTVLADSGIWAFLGDSPLATEGWPRKHGNLANSGRAP